MTGLIYTVLCCTIAPFIQHWTGRPCHYYTLCLLSFRQDSVEQWFSNTLGLRAPQTYFFHPQHPPHVWHLPTVWLIDWLICLLAVCIENSTVSWQYSSLVQGQLKGRSKKLLGLFKLRSLFPFPFSLFQVSPLYSMQLKFSCIQLTLHFKVNLTIVT